MKPKKIKWDWLRSSKWVWVTSGQGLIMVLSFNPGPENWSMLILTTSSGPKDLDGQSYWKGVCSHPDSVWAKQRIENQAGIFLG